MGKGLTVTRNVATALSALLVAATTAVAVEPAIAATATPTTVAAPVSAPAPFTPMTPPSVPPKPSAGAPAVDPLPAPSAPTGQPATANMTFPIDTKNPMAVALDQARRSGKRVEIVSAETETTTTWANPDGTLTTAVASGPVRVMQGGKLVPVDTALVSSAGVVAPKAGKGSVALSAGGAAGSELASMTSGASRIALRWLGTLPAPTLSGDTATYHDVAPGEDLVVKVTTTGFETFVVLRVAPTAPPVIRIPVALQNLSLTQVAGGGLRLADAAGNKDIEVPSLVMSSAARDPRADEPTQVRTVDATVEQGANGPELVLRPDYSFLTDQATVYPVTIDPASTLTANLSNYVDTAWPTQNYDGSTDLKVGTWNDGGQITRSFIRFDMSSIKGTQVSFAQLNMYEWWAYSCTDAPMWIDGVTTAFNPGTTWNNQPSVDGRHWYNWSFSGGYSGCPGTAGWKYLDITGLVQQWSSGAAGPNSLALLAANEYDNYQWKKFYSVNTATPPAIYVTYAPTQLPGTPQNVHGTPGNGQATATWSAPSNLGTPALSSYTVYTSQYNASNNSWSVVRTDSVCGTCTSKTVTGLANGATYAFTVQSVNSVGPGGYAASNAFVPAAPPGPPQNLASDGGNATAWLRWVPPANNGGALDYYTVALYDITSSPSTLVYSFNVSGTTTATRYPIAGAPAMTNNRIYQFMVWAYNAASSWGPGSVSNAFVPGPTDALTRAGERDYFTYDTYGLSDTLTATVNVGTGNLELAQSDLTIPMVGGAMPLTRTFNSLSAEPGAAVNYSGMFGYFWQLNQAPDIRLTPNANGSVVTLNSATLNRASFTLSGSSYTAPLGLDATLSRDASDGSYALRVHGAQISPGVYDADETMVFRADGALLTDSDRNGNKPAVSWLDLRRPAAITGAAGAPPGNTVTFNYGGPNGQVSSISATADGITKTVSFTYDSIWRLWKVTDAVGRLTTFTYDANNGISQITGPPPVVSTQGAPGDVGNQVTKFAYDASHRVISIERVIPNSNGVGSTSGITRYDYTTPGHTKVTDPLNHPPTDFTIDPMGRVTATLDAKGATSSTVWTTTDAKVGTFTNALNGTTTNTWGANNGQSLTEMQTPTGVLLDTSYNVPGHPFLPGGASDSAQNWTMFGYDTTGNRNTAWNNALTLVKAVATYNADGTLANSTEPDNITPPPQDLSKSTNYDYFPGTHQLKKVTPPVVTPGPGSVAPGPQNFTYDGFGRLKTATSGKGVTTTYSYDNLDRVTMESHSDSTPTVSYLYDALGNLYQRNDASGVTTYRYDAANRLLVKGLPGGAGSLTYTYDLASNMTSATGSTGKTTLYSYDKLNRLDQVTEPQPTPRTDIFAYNAAGERTDTWYNTGTTVTYDASGNNLIPPSTFAAHILATYDVAGQLREVKTTGQSSDLDANRLADMVYSYTTPSGCATTTPGVVTAKRQTVTDKLTGKVTTYCYDPAGRLTQAATIGGSTYLYSYSNSSNRTADSSGTHSFNAADQLTDPGYTYDADRNLTGSPTRSLAYNGIGQTMSITPAGSSTVPLAYSGSSQAERTTVGSTTSRNGILGVDAETTSGATTTYIRDAYGTLLSERTPAGDYYYYYDGLGSVIGLVDPIGTSRASYTYDPYGANATATNLNGPLPANPWRYAGGYLDAATGLYHFGARYYDPALGRWTQPDPLGPNTTPYAYCVDDPVNCLDTTGLWADLDGGGSTSEAGCVHNPVLQLNLPSGITVDDLSKAAAAPDRNNLTGAGRALQKHGDRPGVYPKSTGTADDRNIQGQEVVDDILTDPTAKVKIWNSPTQGRVIDIRTANGWGARWSVQGRFIGLL